MFIGPGAILTNDRTPAPTNAAASSPVPPTGRSARSPSAIGASIGAGAVVVAGYDVGAHAMVGAGAVVTRDVAPHALVVGNPARLLGWVCVCGERLGDADGRPAAASIAGR